MKRPLLFFVCIQAATTLAPVLRAQDVVPPSTAAASSAPTAAAQPSPTTGATEHKEVVTTAANVAPKTAFSFHAEGIPIKQALALFARANGLNIVPDLDIEGEVTVDFTDLPLDLAMDALLEANGYYFTQEGRLIRIHNRETRLFQIDYIHTTRAGTGSNAVQISSGGGGSGSSGGASGGSGGGAGGSNEGSTMTVTNTATINFWGDLGEQLKTLISEKGSFTINGLAGTVMVRDNHRNVESIGRFLASVTANVVRQVDLEVEIYEVALSDSTQLGINWQRVEDSLDSTVSTIPGQLGLPGNAGLIVQNPIFGNPPGGPGVRIALSRNNTSVVVDALRQQGNLKVVSKPRLRTLNNQPAVVRVGQDIPVFTRQVTQSPGTPPVITVTESIQTITVGTVLSITPQISAEGLVTLDITPAVSRLVRTETSASGDTTAPVIDIRQASSIVRLHDGDTVVMGGLVQDGSTTTRRKIPLLGDVPVLGKLFTGKYDTSDRTELIFFLTPRIIHDEAGAKPLKTAVK
ncbi:MAG TPA: secretin N-terminal domain-containing protein [Opitutaceae bacterium]|nr:secretin N-terminal domain-containing protein [Opitutaceae bacterium]